MVEEFPWGEKQLFNLPPLVFKAKQPIRLGIGSRRLLTFMMDNFTLICGTMGCVRSHRIKDPDTEL